MLVVWGGGWRNIPAAGMSSYVMLLYVNSCRLLVQVLFVRDGEVRRLAWNQAAQAVYGANERGLAALL